MKGKITMKIAVTYENGNVFQHFGHSAQFKIYETENGEVIRAEVVDTNGSGHGALAGFLQMYNVNVLICGGIGAGAKNALTQAGIQLFGGVQGNADQAVNDYLAGKLMFNPEASCSSHHEGDHHCGEHHSCGGHCHS